MATYLLIAATLLPKLLAEQVITDLDHLTRMQSDAEAMAFALLALQAPVAGDLRAVVGTMQNVAGAQRIGGLALHVATIARRRQSDRTLPEEVNGYFAKMGRVAMVLGNSARDVGCHSTLNEPHRSVPTMRRWTNCTDTSSRF